MKFDFLKFLMVIVCLFIVGKSNGQLPNDYSKQWKKVDDLVTKGLTKSALQQVVVIYETAKKDKNDAQVIKALLYQVTLNENIQEDANINSILNIEKEIITAKEPARSILYSISAEMYWNFFQQNRYKLYNRTNTANFKKDDIQTWTADDLHKKIAELYLSSLKNEKLLQQTSLAPFDAIIIKGNVRFLRPTLYDLLAHRALDYFKNDERDISQPAYAFEIKDIKVFAPASEFAIYTFKNKDSASLHYQALRIFQKLLFFHENDAKPDALIDADIERLSFALQYGVMNNKADLYINALDNLAAKYQGDPASAQAIYLKAQKIYDNAVPADRNANSNETRYTVKQAKELAETIAKKFPRSEGGINAQNLLNQILRKEIHLTSEKVNIPGEPFRTLVNYKNFTAIHLRLIELTPDFRKQIIQNNEDSMLWVKLTKQKAIRSWKQDLPPENDYLSHSTEIKIDGLPVGEYALLASVSEDFNLSKNALAAQYLYVSNISYLNNGNEYFVLHRQTGKPLAGAKVQVWTQRYDYSVNRDVMEKKELLTTDKNGYLKLAEQKKNENRAIRLDILYQDDKLFLDDYQYSYNYNSDENANSYNDQKKYDVDKARIFLFTDRSIYRPGQLVYFKGIGVTQDYKTKRSKLLVANDSILIMLTDANGQKVDSVKLLLNDFGSLNGKFRLPENQLNGQFTIRASGYNNAEIYFSVEEYKRPKFYTEFEKVKGSYRVNDKIKITGFAKAYAGNNVDGANVKYRVTRVARFLYPWMFWSKGFPQTKPLEIASGEIKTGTDGKFIIEFEAIPDLSVGKNTDPVFDFKVEADVTDINGETRSGNTIVPVGYKSLNLQITLPQADAINVDSLNHFLVSTKNLSGEFEPTKVEVKIYKLLAPQRLIRSRYWAQPDEFILSREEFIKYFPNDEYKDESKKETWQKGDEIFSKEDSTGVIGIWLLDNSKHPPFTQGWYVIEATAKDKYGQDVKNVKYFQLYDVKDAPLPAPAYSWNAVVKNVVEPGEKATFIAGTSANDIFLIQQLDKPLYNGLRLAKNYQFYSLNNEKKTFEFSITEQDRGGFGVYQFFVKDNRVYNNSWNVAVPWTNKQLDITYETFRDKTLPGSDEKYKVKISGSKGEKVAAEMLVSMYDASLDQFKPHSWSPLDIWPTYNGYGGWISVQNFNSVQSFERAISEEYLQAKDKIYDALNYIHFDNPAFVRGYANEIAYDRAAPMMKKMSPQSKVKEAENPIYDSTEIIQGQKTGENKILFVDQSQIQIRKNFNETAFFFRELRTDKDGNVEFNFTIPQALTQWKLMTFAHTKELATGYNEKSVITQKELMVQPDPPRFLREGDQMEFSSKIVNLGAKEITGQAELQLLNASTMTPVDGWFKNIFPVQYFTAAAGQSTVVKFNIEIPFNYNNAVVYRIVAKAGTNSDGEEAPLPVLTNRMLVTETMPLPVRGNAAKTFTFQKLLTSGKSETLSNFSLTTEFTTNPAWYAVQALPYLMEYPYECAEQTFNRYYANSIASKIVSNSPKIKAVFEKWKITDTAALLSNLQKNEELKSVLLQETPWVLEEQNETQQKKNIALLFDMVRMSNELETSIAKLKDMQAPNGGFVWFKGGPDDRYITQYIVTGIGHIKKIKAYKKDHEEKLKAILNTAIPYLDRKIKEDYDNLIKYKSNLKNNNLGSIAIQYLYMRSFFPEYPVAAASLTAYNYYHEQSKKYWLSESKYMQGMIALSLFRTNDNITPHAITRSLKENSINNDELGMYWKEWNVGGYWWYQAPVESQAMMIEAFDEVDKDQKAVDDLKTWLLKNKQTNNWHTTKATAEACYALLLQGSDTKAKGLLDEEKNVTIKLGNTVINSNDEKQEAGTGYFKTRIDGDKVKPEMGNISVTMRSDSKVPQPGGAVGWGAVYWQYFENLDKITFSETPLKLSKKLFIEKNTDRGPVLTPVNGGTGLKVGDKIKVRIELRVDRDMEYVHMKDMRAACMEPTNVISEYKYQGGLGYYETTKDASTNFFFSYLNKGTYVFEYPMFVTHSGNFSNGITTIQCMYAPEFTAHSEGVRVTVAE
ncbi:MAG: alpha-2-macroglobulin [Chitinophagaceae bacterium]|nr:alpha-2-macroglobulin [Chitinophagaceae bacterium]